jgi:hypothetical protein
VLGWDGEVLETAALGADVDSWSSSSMGVIFVEVDGVGSEPLVVPGGDELLVVAIEPQLHEVGGIVEFVFSRPTSDPLEARWADVSATCFSTDPSQCRATVPIGASGFVEVVADGVTLPSIASGISGSPTSIASGPWIDWANRRSLRSGVPTLVVISTLGGAPTATGADLELIELTQTRAVISLMADGETATIRVRDDEWSFAVE